MLIRAFPFLRLRRRPRWSHLSSRVLRRPPRCGTGSSRSRVAADAAPPAEGVPHLVSPENLPPGTSITPVGPQQSNGRSYLRELWHAVQTQEVSGKDALLLLTQRPLNANATPPPGLAANPAADACCNTATSG